MSSSPSSSEQVAPWEQAWRDIQPTLSSLYSTVASWPKPKARIMRVGQLDAELLDQELTTMLKEPINKALGQLGSVYETRYDPEITLIIRAILYKFSMWDNGATYGARLQDLRFKATRVSPPQSALTPSGLPQRSLLVHGCLTVIVPYIHTRIRTHALSKAWPDAPSNDRKRRAWELLTRMEATHATFGLIGFIVFLYDGRYRTIADRLSGLKLAPSRSIARRSVSYEFMNRQMVWHAFTEFLIFITPLINARKVRRRLARFFSKATDPSFLIPPSVLARLPRASSSSPPAGDAPQQESRQGKYWALSPDQCAICAENASYDIAHLSAAADSTARTLAAETSPNSSAYGYTPISGYAVRASRSRHASSDSQGVNSLSGADSTPEKDFVGADAASDGTVSPPFPITTPYRASCGHAYCYFCLSEKIIHFSVGNDNDEDNGYWECLRCEQRVTSAERVLAIDGGRDEDEIDSLDTLSDVDRDVG